MTPAEKSEGLINKFYELRGYGTTTPAGKAIAKGLAQQCAIICVEQIIEGIKRVDDYLESITNYDISDHIKYYEEVLEHIKNS